MTIYPAIDLIDKQAVRLYKGQKEKKKIYGDPIDIAKAYARYFDHLHIIDLDGAFSGETKNLETVREIVEQTGLKIQYGGGLRTIESIRKAYLAGITHVIISTKAFDTEFVRALTQEFDSVTVSLDSRQGKVSVAGWLEESGLTLEETFEGLKNNFSRFIFTDIEKDGTNGGISDFQQFWKGKEVIYAGGVFSLEDIRQADKMGFSGVVIGRALLEGTLTCEQLKGVL